MSDLRFLFTSVLLLLLGFLCRETVSHVALTFPPARKYDLDFLDTFRTKTPCGMESGSVKTTISNGDDLTISWHLGYPHRGSFVLELLDKSGNKVKDLTPGEGKYVDADPTSQNYTINIDPNLECSGCTIRLLRQALEWGKSYRFQSCSDVDIVSKSDFQEDCLGNGVPRSSGCECNEYYVGSRCQHKNECDRDDHCSHGRCLDIGGTSYPAKQCYCQPGWFGPKCDLESIVKNKNSINISDYEVLNFGRGVEFLWRIDGTDFEGFISGPTTSYLAVGWRPSIADKSCQGLFPTDAKRPSGTDFNSMDCLDIVLGTVKNGLSRIGDYYTRDRSTPRMDNELWGEKFDLTAAYGWEEDGVTNIWFRRPVRGTGGSDHPFYGKLHIVWAYGQSGVPFYTADELKYHGPNKGVSEITVTASAAHKIVNYSGLVLSLVQMHNLF